MSESTPDEFEPLPALKPVERRILGVLVEKAFTTPDAYPLSANATVTACNQKSNRDPVVNYELHEIDSALLDLKEAGLVIQVFSATGRVERWKHDLRDAWDLERPHLSILAELMLRGPQSEGDLRARASRMSPIDSLDQLRDILAHLASLGFVRRLSPEGRKRGVLWGHLLLPERELAELESLADREHQGGDDDETPAPRSSSTRAHHDDLSDRLAQLEERVRQLEDKVEKLIS